MTSLDTPSHDPYDLNKLAKELAERDAAHSESPYDQRQSGSIDLPELQPLAHDNVFLSTPEFDVEAFLLSRANVSLSDLRTELREYLAALKEELVQLINDDYEAFISLSTDLQGEGMRLERVQYPMGDLRSRIAGARSQLEGVQNSVKERLDRRASLRQEKAFLQLLLKISDSTTRLESLLLITNPSDEGSISQLTFTDSYPGDDRSKDNRSKHLLRITSEYSQLLYHLEKASSEKSEFLEEMQWRIDRIMSRLTSDLEQHFTTILLKATLSTERPDLEKTSTGKPDLERTRLLLELTDCLRAYDMLGLWRDAEDIIRREVVRGFVKKTIHPSALSGPHSPLMPHTPHSQGSFHNAIMPPTPFTPAAFTAKQTSFFQSSTSSDSNIFLLDESDGSLAALYNQVLRFVSRDLKPIMDIADRFRTKKQPASVLVIDDEAGSAENENCFDILSNVLWAELSRSIMDDLGSQVFAVGKPNEFKKNFETTQNFILSIEFLAPSVHSVRRLRRDSRFVAFERRWQLPVYFQLRWKEVVGRVEQALESRTFSSSLKQSKERDASFLLDQSLAIWNALCQCWDTEIFILDLGPRFWRLTLQILKRYQVWIESVMSSLESPLKLRSPVIDKSPGGAVLGSRASTPVSAQDPQLANRAADDDKMLSQCATLMHDIRELERALPSFYKARISPLLPELTSDDLNASALEEILLASVSPLTDMLPILSTQVEDILVRRCCEALVSVKSLPGQFRATSQKHMPSKPSNFVPMILRPVKTFFDVSSGHEAHLEKSRKEYGVQLSSNIVEAVSARYMTHLSAMKKNEESLRRLRTGQRTGFSLFGGSSSNADNDAKDEERIRTQLSLDVEAFGKDAEALGVNLDDCTSFKALNYMVHANVSE